MNRARIGRNGILAFVAAGTLACEPSLNERTDAITSPEILAVRADPPEGLPGANVTLTTLYVGPSGPITSAPLDWAFCTDRNPLSNLGPVSPACAARTGSGFVELGAAATETGTLPLNSCLLFGPDTPPVEGMQPPGRPVDADPTGGYYQPVRLAAGDQIAIGMVRITCDVPGASPAILGQLAAETHPNTNPAIDAVEDPGLGTLVAQEGGDAGTNAVSPSQRLALTASWADCDPSAKSCTGSEGYAFLDPQTGAVVETREEMQVAWFATGGTFDDDTTGRAATDPTPSSTNGWTAPGAAGTVYLWVILRDDRGGVGWNSYVVDVK